jgi:hypothetical protein
MNCVRRSRTGREPQIWLEVVRRGFDLQVVDVEILAGGQDIRTARNRLVDQGIPVNLGLLWRRHVFGQNNRQFTNGWIEIRCDLATKSVFRLLQPELGLVTWISALAYCARGWKISSSERAPSSSSR